MSALNNIRTSDKGDSTEISLHDYAYHIQHRDLRLQMI